MKISRPVNDFLKGAAALPQQFRLAERAMAS
jgi:hypothetical protein